MWKKNGRTLHIPVDAHVLSVLWHRIGFWYWIIREQELSCLDVARQCSRTLFHCSEQSKLLLTVSQQEMSVRNTRLRFCHPFCHSCKTFVPRRRPRYGTYAKIVSNFALTFTRSRQSPQKCVNILNCKCNATQLIHLNIKYIFICNTSRRILLRTECDIFEIYIIWITSMDSVSPKNRHQFINLPVKI